MLGRRDPNEGLTACVTLRTSTGTHVSSISKCVEASYVELRFLCDVGRCCSLEFRTCCSLGSERRSTTLSKLWQSVWSVSVRDHHRDARLRRQSTAVLSEAALATLASAFRLSALRSAFGLALLSFRHDSFIPSTVYTDTMSLLLLSTATPRGALCGRLLLLLLVFTGAVTLVSRSLRRFLLRLGLLVLLVVVGLVDVCAVVGGLLLPLIFCCFRGGMMGLLLLLVGLGLLGLRFGG